MGCMGSEEQAQIEAIKVPLFERLLEEYNAQHGVFESAEEYL